MMISSMPWCLRRGAVAQWLEHQTVNQKDRGLNPPTAVSKLGQFQSPTLPVSSG